MITYRGMHTFIYIAWIILIVIKDYRVVLSTGHRMWSPVINQVDRQNNSCDVLWNKNNFCWSFVSIRYKMQPSSIQHIRKKQELGDLFSYNMSRSTQGESDRILQRRYRSLRSAKRKLSIVASLARPWLHDRSDNIRRYGTHPHSIYVLYVSLYLPAKYNFLKYKYFCKVLKKMNSFWISEAEYQPIFQIFRRTKITVSRDIFTQPRKENIDCPQNGD
jgi:hypothetical protein